MVSARPQSSYPTPIGTQRHPLSPNRMRQKSLPPLPVSRRAQETCQASHVALHSIKPPAIAIPFPPSEEQIYNRAPSLQQTAIDHWRCQKSFWAHRNSIDSERYAKSTRPSMEFCGPQPQTFNHGRMSFDARPQVIRRASEVFDPRPRGVPWRRRDESLHRGIEGMSWEQQGNPYGHTRGTYYYSKEANIPFFAQHDVGYPAEDEQFKDHYPKTIHWRGTPTSTLRMLDGYAGDMAYEHEPGMSMGTHTGVSWKMGPRKQKTKRKNIKDSHAWDVAMNAVPGILQKAKIKPQGYVR